MVGMTEPDWRVIALGMPTGIRKMCADMYEDRGSLGTCGLIEGRGGVRSSFADR